MKRIALNRGLFAIVDDQDFDLVSRYNWYAVPADQNAEKFYAGTSRGTGKSGRSRCIRMHRLILEPPSDMLVDHINGDGLDNRRSNIRVADLTQNNINRTFENPLGFRGVERMKEGNFRAKINCRGVVTRTGRFETVEDAARAYDALAIKLHGEFAMLNFP